MHKKVYVWICITSNLYLQNIGKNQNVHQKEWQNNYIMLNLWNVMQQLKNMLVPHIPTWEKLGAILLREISKLLNNIYWMTLVYQNMHKTRQLK